MKRKFLVLNTTSSVQKKEGMGESQNKRKPYYRSTSQNEERE
jgi:hypothetical protein